MLAYAVSLASPPPPSVPKASLTMPTITYQGGNR
jgi:hypothetical protein